MHANHSYLSPFSRCLQVKFIEYSWTVLFVWTINLLFLNLMRTIETQNSKRYQELSKLCFFFANKEMYENKMKIYHASAYRIMQM